MDKTSKKQILENQPPDERVPNIVDIQNQNIYPTSDHSISGEKNVNFQGSECDFRKKKKKKTIALGSHEALCTTSLKRLLRGFNYLNCHPHKIRDLYLVCGGCVGCAAYFP